jgi:hypothetical protein
MSKSLTLEFEVYLFNSGVEGLFHSRPKDLTKGAIYFCYPDVATMDRFIQDFGDDPLYSEAFFISSCQTDDTLIEMVRNSQARKYLKSWKDGFYDFSSNLYLSSL